MEVEGNQKGETREAKVSSDGCMGCDYEVGVVVYGGGGVRVVVYGTIISETYHLCVFWKEGREVRHLVMRESPLLNIDRLKHLRKPNLPKETGTTVRGCPPQAYGDPVLLS